MSRTSRVFNIVSGVVMIICSWILFRNPDVGLEFAAMILGISLFLSGIHYLYYYFSMARHMVGGISTLMAAIGSRVRARISKLVAWRALCMESMT